MGKYEASGANRKKRKPSRKKTVWIAAALVLLALAAAVLFAAAQKYVYFVGSQPVLIIGEQVDLRSSELTKVEYEALKARYPHTHILWSIPVCGGYFPSDAEAVSISQITPEDIPSFAFFERLKTVDASQCPEHETLKALELAYPELEVNWRVHLGGDSWSRDAETVDLSQSAVSAQEITDALGYLEPGCSVLLNAGSLTKTECLTVKEAFPELRILWTVELMGQQFSSDTESLSFVGKTVDPDALIAAADQLPLVREIDLSGCGCSLAALVAIKSAYPEAFIRSELTLYGVALTTDAAQIDLSGIQITDTTDVEQAAALMPNLQKVVMSDCGISNEDMDALNKRHENVRFVWTVYFSVYSLRTDATVFIASNLPQYGYHAMKLNSQQLQPLRYCTDLIALDLGHMPFEDLSFLEEMHDLQYLIMVENRFSDISILAQMEDLFYLEIFNNTIDDISPLLECKNLRHLNIGYTRGYDLEPLKQMTWLERLWYPCNSLSESTKQELIQALPDTELYMPGWDDDGCTGGTWRTTDVYYEMRNVFGMFYQPPGTGMHNEE